MDDDLPAGGLAGFMTLGDWLDRYGGPFFPTRASFDWFVKRHRSELVECGALIPRQGRAGSLVAIEGLQRAVVRILRRRALEHAA